ncbi:MAG: serine/threonine-protein kinase [Pseudomonadota bacterium]
MSDNKNERWQRIDDLVNGALSQAEQERDAWLLSECGDDTELFDEVMSLLAFDAEKTGGVRGSIEALASDLRETAESMYIGERVGNYRITRKLAEGGMGIVFLAEHAADDFDQQVAVKILPQHRLDSTAGRRFVEERRILAGLEHPNIARLIDGGTLPSGVPFIVMEYVDGKAIDAWCRDEGLDNEAIIDLVAQVCNAVHYAHRKLVIHRDIKPGNILVNRDGVPKLLDFGIAKLLDPGEMNPEQTRAEHRALTPMYASPEQIEGLPITTAADVYGLGLLLYRLLTGHMPYAPTGPTPRELEDAILSQTPERPSTVVVAAGTEEGRDERWRRRQQKALRGELDTILLTALRKDPERRYGSVQSLRDDLQRYREHRPIQARGDSPVYVLGKFLRRHRLPVGLAAAAVLAGIIMTSYYTHRLQIERDTAEGTAAFLQQLFEARDPYQRNKDGLTVETLLTEGIEKLESDESLSPLVRARLLTTISLVLRNLGELEQSETTVNEALEIIAADRGADAAESFNPLRVLFEIRLRQARYDEAKELGERLNALASEHHGDLSPEAAQATHVLWIVAYRTANYDDMVTWGEKTYAIRTSIYEPNDMAIAAGATALGITYWQRDDLDKASRFYAESRRIQNAQPERNDMQYAGLLHNLGLIYNDSGRYEQAIESYSEAVAIRKAAGAEKDPVLPLTLYSLAHSLSEYGDDVAAHTVYLETVQRQAAVAGPETHMVAYALTGQGMFLESINAPDIARPILEEADRIYSQLFDEPHFDQASTWIGLGYVSMRNGDYDAARALMNRALALREAKNGAENPGTVRTRNAIGRLEYERGNFDVAAEMLESALALYDAGDDSTHPFAAEASTWLGRVRLAEGAPDAAVVLLEKAVQLGEARNLPSHVENVRRRLWLAEARLASGDDSAQSDANDARRELERIEADWAAALTAHPVPSLDTLLSGMLGEAG